MTLYVCNVKEQERTNTMTNKRLTKAEKETLEMVNSDLRTIEAFLDGMSFIKGKTMYPFEGYRIRVMNDQCYIREVLRGKRGKKDEDDERK